MNDFRQEALDFVIKHKTASHTPVELIQKAMQIGANETMKKINKTLRSAAEELDKKRRDSRPHNHNFKPIPLL